MPEQKSYEVTLAWYSTARNTGTVEVEAADADEAREKALALAEKDGGNGTEVEWEAEDLGGDGEFLVDSVEEVGGGE